MHCFSCDVTLGSKPFHDKPTDRYYCETCKEIIWDSFSRPDNDALEASPFTVEDILFFDDLPSEETFKEFNIPAEEDY